MIGRLGLGFTLLSTALAGGCARRAYNDVYVENMAAEIRDLEDQLYEFDGEYRVMEQQLEALRSENARLRGALPTTPKTRAQRQETIPNGPISPSDGTGSDYFVPRSGGTPAPAVSPNKATPSPAPSLEIGPELQPIQPTQPIHRLQNPWHLPTHQPSQVLFQTNCLHLNPHRVQINSIPTICCLRQSSMASRCRLRYRPWAATLLTRSPCRPTAI